MISLILVGAGKGERLGLSIPKSFVKLKNKELFLYSIEKFYKFVKKIFLALPDEYTEKSKEIIKDKFSKVVIVKGGERRQDSVFNCLEKVEEDIVLIHDIARPFVSENLIKKVIEKTKKYGVCIPVLKISDSIKELKGNFVKRTLDREKIFLVQTPQGFKTDLIKKAYYICQKEKIVGVDDSFFLEKIGYGKIYCVEGERNNIKITYPEDLLFSEFLLKKWERA
ncbi:MAG: 2-C-methyl-D-erythritol 4-phosphate cytidylyltransferase [Candidatus Omnitrophica bacterium]|nr:2-C-methyl-D-erythritol 4-phosphate cytidylyltransferase [Candidatus Omnitrophota bacterium]